MQPEPLVMQDALKQYQHDQDKIISPEATVARFKQQVAQSGLSLLDDVVRIDNGRLDIPVYLSICGPDARETIGNYKQMGKGATPSQAQASAVMELAERFSLFSFHRNASNFIHAPFDELQEPTVGLDMIARSVSDNSHDLAAALDIFSRLPLKWTWAFNLTQGRSVMVPFNWFWTINEFNGASAGNCNEEAICQGICEVVERHVSALVSRGRHTAPRIDLETIKDPVALELITKYHAAGIELVLSDFTMDMGIASIGALAWDPSTFPEKSEIIWTAGTMPGPAKALCRTLTEVAQLAGDFNSGGNYIASGLPKLSDLSQARHVIDPGRLVPLNDIPDLSDANIKTEVLRCVAALARHDMEVFLINVRHPLLDVPAFYTIIPGTQFRERAVGSNVAMMCAKIASETCPAPMAMAQLCAMDDKLPGKYFIQFYLGKLHLENGDYINAVRHLNKAAVLSPPDEDLAAILTYLGIGHKEMAQYPEALSVLEKADALDPERTDTLNLMGFCHFKSGAHDEAVRCFERVIQLNPGSAIDYANLAVNHRALGHTEKAIRYYRVALTLDPDLGFAREHLDALEG